MSEDINDPVTLSSLVASAPWDETVRPAIMIVAFEGWNDAGDAASEALRLIRRASGAKKIPGISDDDFYDYQFSRPQAHRTASGKRSIKWPTTHMYRAELEDSPVDLVLLRGVEPTYRWKAFISEILTRAEEENVQAVMALGALLADVPHTRPIQASVTSDDPAVRKALGVQESSYEGPTGILGVLAQVAEASGLPTLSIWSAVPHYVAQAPSPKAQLALLHRVEEFFPLTIDLEELTEDALAWERGVNELAKGDTDIAAYVHQLEQAQDETELPEATGEAIAREFERYLKRRSRPDSPDEPGGPEGR
ncbi:PAC2 family protein [Paeniglutamicibacter kerguelensis]|uniref:Proteasome assembly chaperone (PAC2) family protein n=1 Tax=Paeniglutamicibacter kerguelensis TaxID=254788 RepID=A0ABS4XC39_9MICC|nr:proteasome assembly chaperone (PAC2) family protein [Paeniglutamicibacter kerguelensis]